MPTTETAMMTTEDVANRLYDCMNNNQWKEAQEELYDKSAVSIEPPNSPGLPSVEGMEAIKQKAIQWENMVEETHGGYVSKPIVAGKFFAVSMGSDITMKGMGRMKLDEIAVYEVNDGKIVKEQFFY